MDLASHKASCRDGILLGTHYYRAPSPPPAEWADDLKKVKDLGLELIQVRPQWRWHERRRGVYQWDDLDGILDLAEGVGLKVMVKFMLETAPAHVFELYDGYRLDLAGQRIYPRANSAFYPGGWLPCFDNPDVMASAKAFVSAAVQRYRRRSCVAIWHAWNEPRSRPVGECTCAHSRRSYRQWLRQRFGSVERLNEFTGKCWGAFEDVDAARDSNDFTEMHLWRQWAATRVAWRVGEVAKTIRQADPTRAVIAHVGLSSVLQDALADTSDDYLTRRGVDFYGTSFEPRFTPPPLNASWPFLIPDWIRAVSGDGYFWVNELYPSWGQWAPEFSGPAVAGWMWACIACGAKGLIFWQFKKERLGWETNDAGLIETDGQSNQTTEAVRKVLQVIRRHDRLFGGARVPRAKVALVYDFASDLVSRIEDTRHNADFRFVRDLSAGYIYKAALQGVYHLFYLAGIQVDLVSSHELERIGQYPLAYLPTMFIVGDEQAKVLTDYVAGGGKLAAEGGAAQRQANTWLQPVRPGAGMDKVFGLIETERVVWNDHQRTVTLPTGRSAVSRLMNASFELRGAAALAAYSDGRAAIAAHDFGRGQALMTGFSPGLAYLLGPDPAWVDCIRWLVAQWARLPEAVPPPEQADLYVRRLETGESGAKGGQGTIYFIFNRGRETRDWQVPLAGRELTTDRDLGRGQTIAVAPGEVAVVAT